MSIVGEATGLIGLLGKAWNMLRDRLDPARAQAQRLIETFEAYGIARQQIPRLLPPDLKLPNAAFSTPDRLKDKVTPELLDWAANYLAVHRSWLDSVGDDPHLRVVHYNQPSRYRDWLANRLEVAGDVNRFLHVWKPQGESIPDGRGPLCLVYLEASDSLDGSDFTRYWLLSDHWSLNHVTCLVNMISAVSVARSLGICVLGRDLPADLLNQLEAGKKLIPAVIARVRGTWYPEDLIEPLSGQETEWQKGLWADAGRCLANDGIDVTKLKRSHSDRDKEDLLTQQLSS